MPVDQSTSKRSGRDGHQDNFLPSGYVGQLINALEKSEFLPTGYVVMLIKALHNLLAKMVARMNSCQVVMPLVIKIAIRMNIIQHHFFSNLLTWIVLISMRVRTLVQALRNLLAMTVLKRISCQVVSSASRSRHFIIFRHKWSAGWLLAVVMSASSSRHFKTF